MPENTVEKITPQNVREVIKTLMKSQNYDPFLEMIKIAKDVDTPVRMRADMASELAQYVAPKLKGIDIDAKASGSIQVIVQKFAEEVLADEVKKTIDLEPTRALGNE